MDAVKLGNQLTYSHMGELCLGLAPGEAAKQPLLQAVTDLLDRAQVPYTIEPDILRRLWGKWMLNVGVNQVVMAQEGTYETVQVPGAARERMVNGVNSPLQSSCRSSSASIGRTLLVSISNVSPTFTVSASSANNWSCLL